MALLNDLPGWERLQGTVAGRGDNLNGDAAGTARSVHRHGEAFEPRYERTGEARLRLLAAEGPAGEGGSGG